MTKSVQDLINENKVMMFSKDYCGFCKSAQRLLKDKGVPFHKIEMDKIQDGAPHFSLHF